ncbi:MAG: hypothetical protein PUC66_04345 [Erysipelotrichaceae bacterium]|nr:hypothetical protein [Erysipelotrichaceae bacterium]
MKSRKTNLFLTLASLSLLAIGSGALMSRSMVPVSAGASRSYVASSSSVVDGHINTGDFMTSGGVYGKGNAIVFDTSAKDNSKIVGKTKINNLSEEGVIPLLEASFTLNLSSLAEQGTFSFAFGLPRINSTVQEAGVIELAFTLDGTAPSYRVTEYGDNGQNDLLSLSPLTGMTLGSDTKIVCSALNEKKLTLTIGSTTVLNNVSFASSGEGFVGFFSSQKNVASLHDLLIYGYTYETPENVDYTEYFDDGHYNANVFYSASQSSFLTPSYLGVESDASGNGSLYFSHTGPAYISTRYSYSNFLSEMEIPWIRREAKQDTNGNYTDLISNWFGFAWGVNSFNESASETVGYDNWIQFEGIPVDGALHTQDYFNPRYVLWEKGHAVKIQGMNHNFFSEKDANGRSVFLKITMIDGVFSLYQRYEDDVGYGAPVMTYDFGSTPLGGLRVFTWALTEPSSSGVEYSGVADFKLDNWNIQNQEAKEVRRVVADPGYRENGIEPGSDYDYQTKTDESDLLANRISSLGNDSHHGLWIGLEIGLGVLLLGGVGGFLFALRHHKKARKE